MTTPDDYQRGLYDTIKDATGETAANAKRQHARDRRRATLKDLVAQMAAIGLLVKRFLDGDKETVESLIAQYGSRDVAASVLMAMHQQAGFDVRHVRQTLGLELLVHAVVSVSAQDGTLALADEIACGKALEGCNSSASWSEVGCIACWDSERRPVLGRLGPEGRLGWTGEGAPEVVVRKTKPPRGANEKATTKRRAARKTAKKTKRKGRR